MSAEAQERELVPLFITHVHVTNSQLWGRAHSTYSSMLRVGGDAGQAEGERVLLILLCVTLCAAGASGPYPELPAKVAHGCQCSGWNVECAGVITGTTWGQRGKRGREARGDTGQSVLDAKVGGKRGREVHMITTKLGVLHSFEATSGLMPACCAAGQNKPSGGACKALCTLP